MGCNHYQMRSWQAKCQGKRERPRSLATTLPHHSAGARGIIVMWRSLSGSWQYLGTRVSAADIGHSNFLYRLPITCRLKMRDAVNAKLSGRELA